MNKNDAALEYMRGDEVMHICMISAILRGTAEIIYAAADGVFMRETESGALMLTMADAQKGFELIESAGENTLYCVYQRCFFEYLTEKHSFEGHFECHQAVYRGGKPELSSELEIKPLDGSFAEFISGIYKGGSREYVESRIAAGELFGGFAGGELAGFIGTHEEGGIGLLEVLPAFQRRGYARALGAFMINRELERGNAVLSQVGVSNTASIALHEKMGFELSRGTLFWVF